MLAMRMMVKKRESAMRERSEKFTHERLANCLANEQHYVRWRNTWRILLHFQYLLRLHQFVLPVIELEEINSTMKCAQINRSKFK